MEVVENIYDRVYRLNKDYNSAQLTASEEKHEYVDRFINKDERILDAGCGSGYTLKRLSNEGYNIFGIDYSKVCCELYLTGYPYECIGIIEYCKRCNKENIKYNSVICTDVLEHIHYDLIDETLLGLTTVSDKVLFGIANHSDIKCDTELHIIQKGLGWWMKILSKFYSQVVHIDSLFGDRFFFIECKN